MTESKYPNISESDFLRIRELCKSDSKSDRSDRPSRRDRLHEFLMVQRHLIENTVNQEYADQTYTDTQALISRMHSDAGPYFDHILET